MRPRIFKDARTAQRLRSFLAPRTRKSWETAVGAGTTSTRRCGYSEPARSYSEMGTSMTDESDSARTGRRARSSTVIRMLLLPAALICVPDADVPVFDHVDFGLQSKRSLLG
jgi:hypothetical protein